MLTPPLGEHPSPGIQRFNKRAVRFTLPSDTVVRPSHFPLFIVNLVVPETDKHASAWTDINCGICQVVESQDRSATDGPRLYAAFGRFSIVKVVGGIESVSVSRIPLPSFEPLLIIAMQAGLGIYVAVVHDRIALAMF